MESILVAFRTETAKNFAAVGAKQDELGTQCNRLHGDISAIRGMGWKTYIVENLSYVADAMDTAPSQVACLWSPNGGPPFHKCQWYTDHLHEFPANEDRLRLQQTDLVLTAVRADGNRMYVPTAIIHVANRSDSDRALHTARLLRDAQYMSEITADNWHPAVLAMAMHPDDRAYAQGIRIVLMYDA